MVAVWQKQLSGRFNWGGPTIPGNRKWVGKPLDISHLGYLEGEQAYLRDLLSMVQLIHEVFLIDWVVGSKIFSPRSLGK